ncbi:hypothetical protein VitviT2T_008454 [Vitis vinifera]|uniref:Structure-specific endonuclease subunit SLX1 homolog n=2 Tax=Vitis vinifera TaxID=29760 RepID=A0ABY9C4Z4_VITVI|nr:uncharacterized protein LOC100250139 [Vitis vinifera]WJZ89225.1 hypothetical protein VitviT2T_008454 [Vitis vinifera]|eukprot:XP_002276725.2 PREDICTED: structure-specific endonuclease subunit SLX1 homolog [Vitis vinifera]
MTKRKGRSEISEETLNSEEKGDDFFACYLLASLSPRHKGHSYIGFTVNPRRRIRQHNGEITCGAWKTKRKRPWEMVLCIYGFPTNVSALQFEWAWQHPTESLAVRKAAAGFKSLSGIANKIKLAYTMFTLPAWQSLNLTVNFFSTKYTKHSAGCPILPEHMRVQVSPMDELPCYSGSDQSFFDNARGDEKEELGERGSSSDGFDQVIAHEETALEQFGWIEEHGLRQPGDSPSPEVVHCSGKTQENAMRQPADLSTSKDEHRSPFCLIDSPVRTSSHSTEGTLDKDTSGLSKENKVLTMKQLPATVAADRGKPKISSLDTSCEIEVIDLLSCSPDYRTNPCFKKRRATTVHPEIIDLTNSPIFV